MVFPLSSAAMAACTSANTDTAISPSSFQETATAWLTTPLAYNTSPMNNFSSTSNRPIHNLILGGLFT
jgi:hypothetical protein